MNDGYGQNWAYLNSEDSYKRVREMQLRQAVASSLAMSTGLSRYSRSLFRRGGDYRWHGDERSSPSWLSRVRGQFRGGSLDALIKLAGLPSGSVSRRIALFVGRTQLRFSKVYRRPRLSDECVRAQHHECLVVILLKPDSWRCSCACHRSEEATESLMVDCVDYFIGAVDYALRR